MTTPTATQEQNMIALDAIANAVTEEYGGGYEKAESVVRAALASPAQEPVAWPIGTDDQVEALARECDWNNRRYMTPADYSGWCEQMRKFARLAAPPAPPAQVAVKALEDWSEEDGDVLWWKFPIEEPPYVGTPNDLGITVEAHTTTRIITQMDQEHDPEPIVHRINAGGWPGYHTHWTPITRPALSPGVQS